MTYTASLPVTESFSRGSKRGMLARIPFWADVGAFWRYFRDRNASPWGKIFALLTVAYVVMPVDAIPDIAPVLGWLDDLGLMLVALTYLASVVRKYRNDSAPRIDDDKPIEPSHTRN